MDDNNKKGKNTQDTTKKTDRSDLGDDSSYSKK
jgi:hypothetical protein